MPPPIGGVSMHIRRLQRIVNSNSNFDCAVFDLGRLIFYKSNGEKASVIAGIIYYFQCHLIHLHISHSFKLFIGRISKCLNKQIVFTLHNNREINTSSTIHLKSLADIVIYVSKDFTENESEKVVYIPAYLPFSEKDYSIKSDFTELKAYKNVFVAISSHPPSNPMLVEGRDIYGFDLLLKGYLQNQLSDSVLVLIDPNGTMNQVYESEIAYLNSIGRRVVYFHHPINFQELLKITTIFIRPTRSDGDSIAIREALDLGVNVLASDCVVRPDGAYVYETENSSSIFSTISNNFVKISGRKYKQEDFSLPLIAIYHSLIG